jgi:hypothetical protein
MQVRHLIKGMTDDPVLEEYKICSEIVRHLDEQNWMWGSFLFGGSIAGAGFVLSQNLTAFRLLTLSLLSTAILGGYTLYIRRGVSVKDACCSRMREIEVTHFRNTVLIEQRLRDLSENFTLPKFEGGMIQQSRIRAFNVLQLMVLYYLLILYGGTIVLSFLRGFVIP